MCVTPLANGPRAVASRAFMRNGELYSRTFTVPGTYRLFCDLHPMTMHEVVEVRP